MLHPILQAKLILQIKQAERQKEKKQPKNKTKKPSYFIGIAKW